MELGNTISCLMCAPIFHKCLYSDYKMSSYATRTVAFAGLVFMSTFGLLYEPVGMPGLQLEVAR